MSYRVETTARFDKEFKKLDRYTQKMIKAWIEKNLVDCKDPRIHGQGLNGDIGLEIIVLSASLKMIS